MSEIEQEQGQQQLATADGSVYLLHDAELDIDLVADFCRSNQIELVPWEERERCPEDSRIFCFLGDERTRDLSVLALERNWAVGVLPHDRAKNSSAALGVKGELGALLEYYLDAPVIEADALTCNGELVFSSVVIGKVLALRPYDINRPQTQWSFIKGALSGLGKMRLSAYTLTTAKEREVSLAALGLIALGQTQSKLLGRVFADDFALADGRLSILALAPRSIFGYLVFLLRLLMPKKIQLSKLPGSLSLLQSNRIHISAPKGAEYLLDGKPVHSNEIELEILEQKLRVLPGPALNLTGEDSTLVDKETVRLNHIPIDSTARALLGKPLPMFDHATEEEYRELFVSLRDNAAPTSSYQVLMILSVFLALGGMYANSAPVIIGAMILAPLMSPIISFSMGLARSQVALMVAAGKTLGIGIGWGLLCAVLMAWAMPLEIPTMEMKARMSPTLLDLLVAVISGMAGAYANAKEEITKSLAGVAIAVALVPPLAVAGIGLGWGDWAMAGGAGLLLITNLAGIALAASATFLFLGFAPFKRAQAGMGVTLGIVLLISLPLTLSFSHLVTRDRILENIPQGRMQLSDVEVEVGQAEVKLGEPHRVKIELSASEPISTAQVDELKSIISARVGEPITLEVHSSIRR